MSIELIPRSRIVHRAGTGRRSPTAGSPALETSGNGAVVRVPLQPRRLFRSSAQRPYWFFFVFVIGFPRTPWGWVFLGAAVPLAIGLLAGAVRMPRIRGRNSPRLALGPEGVLTDDLVVPWSQVESVHRLAVGRGESGQTYLAVRVRDFVGVQGLSPFAAGLANLTRYHRVVLAETAEVADPDGLFRALEHLIAHPQDRALLSSEAGAQLVRVA